MNTILVPLDGSALSEKALPFAVAVAQQLEARVVLVRACLALASLYRGTASAMRIAAARQRVEVGEAEADLNRLAEKLRRDGVEVEGHAQTGTAAFVIVQEADAQGADLIVMLTHGRSTAARFVLGSVADEVLRHAEIPVFLIPPACQEWQREGLRRLLVPLDGSPLAEEVIEPALKLADPFHAELLLVRVVEPRSDDLGEATGYLNDVASRIRQPGRRVRIRVQSGSPAAVLAKVASDESADLIAMATHGRGGLARLILGSVATATLDQGARPLLVVRPIALREGRPADLPEGRHPASS